MLRREKVEWLTTRETGCQEFSERTMTGENPTIGGISTARQHLCIPKLGSSASREIILAFASPGAEYFRVFHEVAFEMVYLTDWAVSIMATAAERYSSFF
jgi:hypothetical protein